VRALSHRRTRVVARRGFARARARPVHPFHGAEAHVKRQRGFTLVELLVAMVLLAAVMALLYSGLNFAARSWDAGDANGRRMADRRIGENFLRRELSELFPMRW